MATYKVIQDIEAEDKFLGPLTLKQFIFGSITVVCLYLSFFFITKNLWFMVIPLLPIMLVGGFLAFPWGRDQPTETWLLAKLRFFLKPHLRVWDQAGKQELVTITAPKNPEAAYTSDNLSQTEVKSRLKALADTIDSRGWAVKNANLNMVTAPSFSAAVVSSDRLIDLATPTQVPIVDMQASDDIMDERSNPLAQHLNQMIQKSEQTHRKNTLQKMEDIREGKLPPPKLASANDKTQPNNYWFMEQPGASASVPSGYATFGTQTVSSASSSLPAPVASDAPISSEEQALLAKIHEQQSKEPPPGYGHMKVIEPLSAKSREPRAVSQIQNQKNSRLNAQNSRQGEAPTTSGIPPDPAILQLANNDDLTVATIARQVHKTRKKEPPTDEVVISLH